MRADASHHAKDGQGQAPPAQAVRNQEILEPNMPITNDNCPKCGVLQEYQFQNDRAEFSKCPLCGNWSGQLKSGQIPMEHDELDFCMAVYLHLGLIEEAGMKNGQQAYRMTAKGRKFKPGMLGSNHL